MMPHNSLLTHHHPHLTPHSSLVTRHTSHVTRHTSHVAPHTSHLTPHNSPPHLIPCIFNITRQTCTRQPSQLPHTPTPHIIHSTPHIFYLTPHTSHITPHTSHLALHTPHFRHRRGQTCSRGLSSPPVGGELRACASSLLFGGFDARCSRLDERQRLLNAIKTKHKCDM
jgi:hypothetical protein